MMQLQRIALALAVAALAAGCSMFGGGKSTDYKGQQARAAQPLEVPPELTAPTMDDRYAIPDPRTQTTYSQYSKATAAGQGTPSITRALPPVAPSASTLAPLPETVRFGRR